jgi:hypothetical protein
VHVCQAFFGAPGNDERPKLAVPLAFTTRAHDPETIKTIVNPRHVYKAGVHNMKFWPGMCVDSAGREFARGQVTALDHLRTITIGHDTLRTCTRRWRAGMLPTASKRDL